ncbi:helix-turn-helix domain-containing protein (plasmid) [Photobacterium leiognathi subsp. mandapamensis]|uniref:helix-turn-helix domain-containing protein n=1 Tax=Photobacterium leiognathi TaxID=553611 RepID=UPI003AF3F393
MTSIELRVAEAVKNSHLTYSEIARQTGAESSAVSKWAKTGKISVNYLAKLCLVLEIDPRYFLYNNHEVIFKGRVLINDFDRIIDVVNKSQERLLNELKEIKDLSD